MSTAPESIPVKTVGGGPAGLGAFAGNVRLSGQNVAFERALEA